MTQKTDRYRNYVTQTGFGLESLANQKGTKVDFAKLVVGDGELPDSSSPASQTDLINQVRHYPVTIEVDDKDPTIWVARAEIPAEDGGFIIREAGVKVTDENGDLYCYARQPGDYKPVLAEGSAKSYTIRLKFIPGNASVIEAKIDPSVQFATPTDLDSLKKHLLALRCGEIEHFDDPNPRPGWVDLDGAPLSRTTDALLWAHAQKTGLLISQALKDSNKKKYAAYWGTGDGSTTFTRPNPHLVGAYTRATPAGVAHGTYQGDAIRNFTGSTSAFYRAAVVSESGIFGSPIYGSTPAKIGTPGADPGANYGLDIDASRQLPTAHEIRPHSINYAAKIHRGWM